MSTSPKRKHSAVLVKRQHTIFSCAKRQHLWTTNGWRNVNPYFGSPPCCLNMTLSVTKKEPEIKKWNESTQSRGKVTWWKKKCQSLFSFSSSPLLRGSTSYRCQVPTYCLKLRRTIQCLMCDVICAMSDKKITWSCQRVKPGLECLYENIGDIVAYYHCQMVIQLLLIVIIVRWSWRVVECGKSLGRARGRGEHKHKKMFII